MESKKPISFYKAQAKDRMLGNYGIAIGSFVLIFACFYSLFSIISKSYTSMFMPQVMNSESLIEAIDTASSRTGGITDTLISYLISLVAGVFYVILVAGYYYMMQELSYGRQVKLFDVFYGFRNHPDKIIIIYLIMEAVIFAGKLPSMIVADYVYTNDDISKQYFALYIVLTVAGLIVELIVSIVCAFVYLIYIDNPEMEAIECLKESIRCMNGHKLSFFYMILSLIGFYILGLASLGIGLLFVICYRYMIVTVMYRDICKGDIE